MGEQNTQTTDSLNPTTQPAVIRPQPVVQPAGGSNPKLMKEMNTKSSGKHTAMLVLGAVLVVGFGVVTGWYMSGSSASTSDVAPGAVNTATEAGIDDEKAFPDTAEGVLVVGSIEGEGTHYLDRGADETKYVYMTSTVIDLEQFVGKKVEVRGATIAARSAPWLMDVGKIKVIK